MTAQEIKEKLKKGERIAPECKKAGSELPESFWETYSAFANTLGGAVLLGVEENRSEQDAEKRYTVVGPIIRRSLFQICGIPSIAIKSVIIYWQMRMSKR